MTNNAQPDIMTQKMEKYAEIRKHAITIEKQLRISHSYETFIKYSGQVDLMNKLVGNDTVEFSFSGRKSGGTLVHAKTKKMGLALEYDEVGYEWSFPHFTRAELFITKGPLAYLAGGYSLQDIDSGCLLTIKVSYTPTYSHFLAKLVAKKFVTQLKHAFIIIDESIPKNVYDHLALAPYKEPTTVTKVDTGKLIKLWEPLQSDLATRTALAEFVAIAPDKWISRIRPIAVARQFNVDELALTSLLLRATKASFFDLRWDILCPSCRGNKSRNAHLSDIKSTVHCNYCNISYDANFSDNVELTFRPTSKVRKVVDVDFCINAPANTKHVLAQVNAWPKQEHHFNITLPEGMYTLESAQAKGKITLIIKHGNPQKEVLHLSERPLEGTFQMAPSFELVLTSDLTEVASIKIITNNYADDAFTASRITTLQEFRDLFSDEVLSPDLQLAVRTLTFLFTDLKDSTRLYESIGDAPAFALVRDHFGILRQAIKSNHGGIVKTIGDAVMAVFTNAKDAVRAAVAIQTTMARHKPEIVVKIGVHEGPCLAVNRNDKLDYFGTTVNKAARIQGQAEEKDIVMTLDLEQTEELSLPPHFERGELDAELKGLSGSTKLVRWRYIA